MMSQKLLRHCIADAQHAGKHKNRAPSLSKPFRRAELRGRVAEGEGVLGSPQSPQSPRLSGFHGSVLPNPLSRIYVEAFRAAS